MASAEEGNFSIFQCKNNSQIQQIPSCNEYPLDKKVNFNMQSSTDILLNRSYDTINKGITENISSGFGSGHDATDSDFDIVNMIANTSSCIQNMNKTIHGQNLISNMVFSFAETQNYISPNFPPFKNFSSSEKSPNDTKIDNFSKNSNTILWDMDQTFNLSDIDMMPQINSGNEIFNLDDVVNISELQNANQQLFQKSIYEDHALSSQFEKIDFNPPQNFVFQHQNTFNDQNQINLNGIQNILADSTVLINNEDNSPQILENSYNDSVMTNITHVLPNLQKFQNTNFQNTDCVPQNVIVRVFQNGQFHLASIDQNFLQQMLNNNNQTSVNVLNNPMMEPQMTRNLVSSNEGIMHKNFAQSVIQKNAETFDLMENPTNWRRIPNNGGYQCNICNKCYTRKYGLKIHLRIHSGFKPLECKVCKKKFGDPSNMAKHIRLHSTEGSPYKCNLCNKPLVRRRDLERHMRSRHPDSVIRANVDIPRRN